ncbi:hypothetical protein [Blastomonas aquatica]|uniref:hypothetical protein n=1 Tax=Blastomonas aquatica TaxID=1510276 RepID=UPI001666A86F|nr:hypothetical protein [Blastomonas aquatica]
MRTYIGVPHWDSWGLLTNQQVLGGFFDSLNGHVSMAPRLIYAADIWLASGSSALSMGMTVLLLVADAWLLVWVCRKSGLSWVYQGFAVIMLLWAYPVANFMSAFNVQIVGVFVLATFAFAAMAFAKGSKGLWLSIAIAATAGFTMANGILAGFLLAPLAFILGRPGKAIATAAIGGAAIIGVYLLLATGSEDVLCTDVYDTQKAQSYLSLQSIGSMLGYLGVYLGAPIARIVFRTASFTDATLIVTGVLGYTGLLVGAFLSLRALFDPQQRQRPIVGFLMALLAFLVGTAAVTAYGRGVECPVYSAATSRYGTSADMFWMTIVLLVGALPLVDRPWARQIPAIGTLLFGLVIAASQPFIVKAMIVSPGLSPVATGKSGEQFLGGGHQADRVGARTAILSSTLDIAALRVIMLEPDATTLNTFDFLRRSRLAPFHPEWAALLGKPMPAGFNLRDRSCSGAVGLPVALPDGGWRIGGMLRGTASQFDHIVAVNSAGLVAGYAMRSPGRSFGEAAMNTNPGWQGHVNGRLGGGSVAVYAFDPDEKTACRFGQAGLPSV